MSGHLLDELALTPDIFDDAELRRNPELKTILPEFLREAAEYALVANLSDGRWMEEVAARLDQLPLKTRDKLQAVFSRLRDQRRLVKHPKVMVADISSPEDWLSEALAVDRVHPLSGVVTSDELYINNSDIHKLTAITEVFDHELWLAKRASLDVNHHTFGMRQVLAPLLRHTRNIHLIDPNIRPQEKRFVTTVQLCLELLGRRGTGFLPGSVFVHSRDPLETAGGGWAEEVEDRVSNWKLVLGTSLSKNPAHSITFVFWRKRPGGVDFHERYILTDHVAVSIPGGLDCFSASMRRVSSWGRMDRDGFRRVKRSFDLHQPTSYILVDRVLIDAADG